MKTRYSNNLWWKRVILLVKKIIVSYCLITYPSECMTDKLFFILADTDRAGYTQFSYRSIPIWHFSYRPIPIIPKPICNNCNMWDFFPQEFVKKELWLFHISILTCDQHLWLRYHFERKIFGSSIAIWDISKNFFGSIATYYYCYSLLVSYRYGSVSAYTDKTFPISANLTYRPIPICRPITITILYRSYTTTHKHRCNAHSQAL